MCADGNVFGFLWLLALFPRIFVPYVIVLYSDGYYILFRPMEYNMLIYHWPALELKLRLRLIILLANISDGLSDNQCTTVDLMSYIRQHVSLENGLDSDPSI